MEIQQIPKVPQWEFKYERSYTKPGVHPYDAVKWDVRDAVITDHKGQVIFEQKSVEVPSFWSQTATNIVASKYFRGRLGTPGRETSIKQLIGRVAGTIARWGRKGNYFVDEEEAENFESELTHILLHQMAAFNSPVWFNVGVEDRPQCSACQPYDAMVSTPYGMTPIGDIVSHGLLGLPVYDSQGITLVTGVKQNGVKKVYRITVSNGISVDVTADHVVLASSKRRTAGTWERVDELKIGTNLQLHAHKGIEASRPGLNGIISDSVPEDEAAVDAAVAGVAVNDRPCLGVQLLDALPQFGERDVDRALDVGLLPLPVLAHVDQDHLFPRFEHLAHDLGGDLEFLKMVPHRVIPIPRWRTRTALARSDIKYTPQITAANPYAATA